MNEAADDEGPVPTPDQVDEALDAFWRGSGEAFDHLLEDESEVSICTVLGDVVRTLPDQCLSGAMTEAYTVIREIGRGGMGLVYEARQERTARNVAVKILQHAGPADEASLQVFRREVEILAGLKHPFIATLHDAGQTPATSTDRGQPFFVMELVEGGTLTGWSAELNKSNLTEKKKMAARLRMIGMICDAVSYAHQRGVIHRDLKPGNILVIGEATKEATPKLLDFGLAALQSETVSDNGRRSHVGTPAYMSPEQKEGRAQEVDTRSDLYALGVILHEMLTGRRPAIGGPLEESLPADLRVVLDKTLRHDRAERYQSVSEFADDIERFLENRPIKARPFSAAYQLRKLASRHRLPAMLLLTLFASALIFAVVFAYQARQVTKERDLARLEARRAEEINAYLSGMFESMDPENVGSNVPVRELLDKAAMELESGLTSDEQVRASLHETIGRGYLALRVLDRSESHLNAAMELKRRLYGENSAAFAASLHHIGLLRFRQGESPQGEQLLQRAYAIRRVSCGERSAETAESLCDLAEVAKWKSNYAESERLLRKAISIHRQLDQPRVLADLLRRLGVTLVAGGQFETARPVLEEALAIQRETLGRDHLSVARTLTDIIEIHQHYAEFSIAEELCREQVRIMRKAYPEGHKDLAIALSELASLLSESAQFSEAESLFKEAMVMEARVERENGLTTNNYAAFLRDQGRLEEAEPLCWRVCEMWDRTGDAVHPGAAYAAQNLGAVLLERGCVQEAEALFQKAIAIWMHLFGEQNPKIANALIGMGRVYQGRGDFVAAEAYFMEAFRIRERRLGPNNPLTAQARMCLATSMARLGSAGSRSLADEALSELRGFYGNSHPICIWAARQLSSLN